MSLWFPSALFDDPFHDMRLAHHNHHGKGGALDQQQALRKALKMDLKENKTEYEAIVDVPGVEKDDVKVSVHDGVLTVSIHREQESKGEDEKMHWTERTVGHASRSIRLPDDVDADAVSASQQNGVLRITMPKNMKQPEPEGPRYISIE